MDSVLQITAGQIFAIIGTIAGGITAGEVIKKWLNKPYKDLETRVKKQEEHAANDKTKLVENDRNWEEQRKTNASVDANEKAILKAQLAMVNHMIDGNGIDGLKEARSGLQNAIIDNQ